MSTYNTLKCRSATKGMITSTSTKELAAQFLGEADPENLNDNEFIFEEKKDKVETSQSQGLFGRFTSGIKNLLGNNALSKENLTPYMKDFVDLLMEKNVAKEIAENLCDSVISSLLKTKTETFTTIQTTIKKTLQDTIYRILTPKEDLDVLKEAITAKGRGEPFKVVFIGVNG